MKALVEINVSKGKICKRDDFGSGKESPIVDFVYIMENQPKSYCTYIDGMDKTNVHRVYHDTEYGFPIKSDDELFGRLILEINQAGLSWETILNKQENFRKAYSGFKIKAIANYKQKDIKRLLGDSGIIRNKLKVNAAIYNANQIIDLQKEHGLHPLNPDRTDAPIKILETAISSGGSFRFLNQSHKTVVFLHRNPISKIQISGCGN